MAVHTVFTEVQPPIALQHGCIAVMTHVVVA